MHMSETINKMLVQYCDCTEICANAYANLNTQTNPKNPFWTKVYHDNPLIKLLCKILVQPPNFEKLPSSP